ncbi:MAG: hypothetical protein H8Z69_05695 [Nanohaloarchaea archaeon]|nr:hypothetical protein [Candidatus Nanohaloarchaea archaeon]
MDTEELYDRVVEGVYSQADIAIGPATGFAYQAADYSELERQGWDKPAHAVVSFSISRASMKAAEMFREDPSLGEKAGWAFATVTLAGLYREFEMNSAPDPLDMAANYAGWIGAVRYEMYEPENDYGESNLD